MFTNRLPDERPIRRARRRRLTAAAALVASLVLGLAAGALLIETAAAGQATTTQSVRSAPTTVPTAYEADPGLRTVVEAFAADQAALARFYPLRGTAARAERMRQFLDAWSQQLNTMDYARLAPPARIDYLLLRNHVAYERRSLDHDEAKIAEVRPVIPFADALMALEEARARMEPVDGRAAASTLSAAAKQLEEIRRRVEADLANRRGNDAASRPATGPATRPAVPLTVAPAVALRAASQLGGLRRALKNWHDNYAPFEPDFAWWVSGPYAKLDKSLDEYAKLLRERVAGVRGGDDDPLVGDPIGRAALLSDLEAEMIGYTPEQIIAIGERELAWCHAELTKAAAEMNFDEAKGGWRAALEHVKNQHVAPGEQNEVVRALAEEAIAYLEQHELVTVPELCKETWQLDMIGREQQRVLPFAAYGGQRMLVASPTADMEHDAKLQSMRGNNVPFTRLVTPHELIPGHHLQGYMAERWRTWRQPFSTPFYVEGWALHWEMVFWDRGYARTPEEKMGMLFWRAHRAARIIVSLKFHLGQMTPPEMIDFLVNEVGHERDNATAEVRRFIGGQYSPLYQAAYMIGGIQIHALHAELVAGGRMTSRQFHDAILQQNAIPIAMVRAALLELPLEERAVPTWGFAGDVDPAATRSGDK